jgi:formylglycine-generating enzyme required for sulfatase activity
MAWVPGGCFWMGSDDAEANDAKPRHRVCVDGFWMDETEVSNAGYAAFAKATAHTIAASTVERRTHDPVVDVAYEDARAYCTWQGRRLPTEAEFALADRVGADVKRYGFYHLSDNFREWASDWYRADYYQMLATNGATAVNPQGPQDSFDPVEPGVAKRVQHAERLFCDGGDCTSGVQFARNKDAPGTGTNQVGFRCALDADGKPRQ